MEIRLLRSFLTVAREQSISGAAQVLHISQPSLSRQIMDLEEELGAKLLHRGNRKVTLTNYGVLLRKRAEQIMELVRKTEEEFYSTDEAVSGLVYIGAGETHIFRILAESIKDLTVQYPDIRFQLLSGNEEDVTERLDRGLIDFGLLIEPADITKYDYIRLHGVDVWGVLMRKDDPLAELNALRPEDLWELPLICPTQALDGGQLTSWLRIDRNKLNVVATYSLLYNASILVETGVGYAVGLDNIINTTGDNELSFRPFNPPLESQVNLVWKKNQVFSKASQVFLEKMRP